ncbi:MAG: sigma-70 family RNA polymerase sigma factor [Anaerolineales bacterium]|nr:sigma-70 family RNA polymerase sigma factor [Anaerolineales bacterium]
MKERTNQEWLEELQGPQKSRAITDLRNYLVEGLGYALSSHHREDMETLIEDFVQEALLKILDNLDTFRGESKLTTWAQKIAVRVAYTEIRRKRWEDVSIEQFIPEDSGMDFTPEILTDRDPNPEQITTQDMLMDKVIKLIETELTERQQQAIYAVMFGGMPLQEVARQMGTNRNALYKMIYDARSKLKDSLMLQEGISPEELLEVFDLK